ncbi:hypothetical protein D3C76_1533910 [compost metagenome]
MAGGLQFGGVRKGSFGACFYQCNPSQLVADDCRDLREHRDYLYAELSIVQEIHQGTLGHYVYDRIHDVVSRRDDPHFPCREGGWVA